MPSSGSTGLGGRRSRICVIALATSPSAREAASSALSVAISSCTAKRVASSKPGTAHGVGIADRNASIEAPASPSRPDSASPSSNWWTWAASLASNTSSPAGNSRLRVGSSKR